MEWSLDSLVRRLADFDQSLTLSFETASGRAGPGYHVTEFKKSTIDSIDCGGTLNSWTEVSLQLLDGFAGNPMNVGKFRAIADKSIHAVEGLGIHEVFVEFSPENNGLAKHHISDVAEADGKVVVKLGDTNAECKVMSRSTSECCGPAVSSTTGCCGTQAIKQTTCC